MPQINSVKDLIQIIGQLPPEVKRYFEHLPALVKDLPLDVALAYAFARVELAQNMALYCGVVRLHRCDSQIAAAAIDAAYITRDGWLEKYKTIYEKEFPRDVELLHKRAALTRDKVMHGKKPTAAEIRAAIGDILEYAKGVNESVHAHGGPKPFGYLRGFKGRAHGLDKKTSRWLLKGMGFQIK